MNEKKLDIKGNELAIILRESLVEKIPLIGSTVSKIISLQQRVRHERIVSFIENFVSSLKGIDKDEINWEYISCQDFFDLMSSVCQRVEQTSSEEKIQRFKEILLNQAKLQYKSEFKDTFLDILLKINEDQIKILDFYHKLDLGQILLPPSRESTTGSRQFEGKNEINYVNENFFLRINPDVYKFLIHDLLSKCLLINFKTVNIGPLYQNQYSLKISPLGKEFLEFIKSA